MGGAIPGKDFLAILESVGFIGAELVADTGVKTSPITIGVLIRAQRSADSRGLKIAKPSVEPMAVQMEPASCVTETAPAQSGGG